MAGNTKPLTLDDVVDQLKTNNKSQEKTNKNLENYFKYLERQRLDQLEALREMMKGKEQPTQRNATDGSKVAGGGLDFNPTWVTNFAASFAALGAALSGFRGWELDAIKNVRQGLKNFKTDLIKGTRNLGLGILRALGIDEVQKRDAQGRFMKGKELSIMRPIRLAITNIQTALTNIFTPVINLGRSIQTWWKGSMTGRGITLVGRVLRTIFEGPISVLSYIGGKLGGIVSGPLGDLIKQFGSGGKLRAILGTIGRRVLSILKPIGFLFSAFEGVKAFQSKKGDLYDKIGAGTGAFLGDFFGSFANLLKDLTSWVLGKLGFKNAEKFLDELDFRKLIRDTVEGIFAFGKKTVKWFEKLFDDPGAALSDLWTGTFGKEGFVNTFIWKPLSKAFDWIAVKLGWKDEGAPPFDLYTTVSGWITDFMNWMDVTWRSIKIFFTQLPDRISLFFEEGWIKLLQELEIGWVKLGSFFKDLPNKLMDTALEGVKATFGEAAFKFANLDKVQEGVRSDSATNATARDQQITNIRGVRNDQLAQIEAQRQALDAAKAKATAPVMIDNSVNNSNNSASSVSGGGGRSGPPPSARNRNAQPGWATGGY